jgi:GDP-L-fucose synthase
LGFYSNKKVLVTGGNGFIGSYLVERLLKEGAKVRVIGRTSPKEFLSNVIENIEFVKGNLLNRDDAIKACKDQDLVFNLASRVAGIGYNIQHSGTMMTENSIMTLNMLDAARCSNVEGYQYVSSTCVYPREASIPTPESEGMLGDPEPSNLGYGWAKRVGELQAKMHSKEFNMKISIIRPMNAYGPRADFDPETSHVIPALIRKILEAKTEISIWGSGNQTRAFVYVDDVARGMTLALEKYPTPDPINIGTNEEIKIKDLVSLIIKITGRNELEIKYDTTKPEGQLRKTASTSKAEKLIGYVPKYSLEEGLTSTIEWFKSTLNK